MCKITIDELLNSNFSKKDNRQFTQIADFKPKNQGQEKKMTASNTKLTFNKNSLPYIPKYMRTNNEENKANNNNDSKLNNNEQNKTLNNNTNVQNQTSNNDDNNNNDFKLNVNAGSHIPQNPNLKKIEEEIQIQKKKENKIKEKAHLELKVIMKVKIIKKKKKKKN